jgi:hypothetical protein
MHSIHNSSASLKVSATSAFPHTEGMPQRATPSGPSMTKSNQNLIKEEAKNKVRKLKPGRRLLRVLVLVMNIALNARMLYDIQILPLRVQVNVQR